MKKDNYFGIVIDDPYRWLEEIDSPDTLNWIKEQNNITEHYLSGIPFREKVHKRLSGLWNHPKYMQPFKSGENYFFLKNEGLDPQSKLYIQKGPEGEPQVLLDPNEFSEDGTVSLVDISISKNGKYLGYSVTKSGSDWLEIFVMEIETRALLVDKIEWVKFSGANWYKDGFFYNKYNMPQTGNTLTSPNDFQMVCYHKLGTPSAEDIIVYSDDSNPHRSYWLTVSEDEEFLFLNVSERSKKGSRLLYKRAGSAGTDFIPVTDDKFEFFTYYIQNIGNEIYLFTNENAPNGKIVKFDALGNPAEHTSVLPESEYPLTHAGISCGRIVAGYMVDVIDRIKVYNLTGQFLHEVTLPGIGSVTGFWFRKYDENLTFYTFESITSPPEIYIYDTDKNTSTLFHKPQVNFDTDKYETNLVFYRSKDGTKVPMFIAHRKSMEMNGNNPAYLYSYGGFGISMNPVFSDSRIFLLESGGVFAMPCIRGGGEYGEKWHEAGMLKNKQNVFDDFIAAAEFLIKEKYTSPARLAVGGGSNGGLLVGAVVNQRPELFRAAFPAVGVMDMLRFQKFSIGSAWVKEYGSSEDEEMFRYILKYSPLHNISGEKNYPAIMVLTSDHDDRVVPSHSFKYTARLKEVYKGDNPVLIRVEPKAGHGFGKPVYKIINEQTDVWSFMFYVMGIDPFEK